MDKNTKDILIYGSTALALYFVLIRPLLQKIGIQKTAEQLEQERVSRAGREKFIEDTLKKQKPSRPSGQFAVWADQLYEYLKYSGISDKKKEAFELLFKFIHRDADIALLSKYFGARQEYNFGLPVGGLKNLSEFVVANLSRDQINRINQAYARSKMTFRF
jgi:hypothetical protein